jgi:hypothetical protein
LTDLQLAKLPDRTPITVTLSITPALNSALAAYQARYREAYGVEAPVTDLIPAMLAQFLSSDRSFAKAHPDLVERQR